MPRTVQCDIIALYLYTLIVNLGFNKVDNQGYYMVYVFFYTTQYHPAITADYIFRIMKYFQQDLYKIVKYM